MEEEEWHPDFEKKSKYHWSQVVVVIFMFLTIFGGFVSWPLFIVGLVGLLASSVWAFKNWDY